MTDLIQIVSEVIPNIAYTLRFTNIRNNDNEGMHWPCLYFDSYESMLKILNEHNLLTRDGKIGISKAYLECIIKNKDELPTDCLYLLGNNNTTTSSRFIFRMSSTKDSDQDEYQQIISFEDNVPIFLNKYKTEPGFIEACCEALKIFNCPATSSPAAVSRTSSQGGGQQEESKKRKAHNDTSKNLTTATSTTATHTSPQKATPLLLPDKKKDDDEEISPSRRSKRQKKPTTKEDKEQPKPNSNANGKKKNKEEIKNFPNLRTQITNNDEKETQVETKPKNPKRGPYTKKAEKTIKISKQESPEEKKTKNKKPSPNTKTMDKKRNAKNNKPKNEEDSSSPASTSSESTTRSFGKKRLRLDDDSLTRTKTPKKPKPGPKNRKKTVTQTPEKEEEDASTTTTRTRKQKSTPTNGKGKTFNSPTLPTTSPTTRQKNSAKKDNGAKGTKKDRNDNKNDQQHEQLTNTDTENDSSENSLMDPLALPKFEDVQEIFEQLGFQFDVSSPKFCILPYSPTSEEEMDSDLIECDEDSNEYYFTNESNFRNYLCQYGIHLLSEKALHYVRKVLTEEEKLTLTLYIRYSIVTTLYQETHVPKTVQVLSSRDVSRFLLKLGFSYGGNIYMKSPESVKTYDRAVDLYEDLAKCGLPKECPFHELTDDELIALELYLKDEGLNRLEIFVTGTGRKSRSAQLASNRTYNLNKKRQSMKKKADATTTTSLSSNDNTTDATIITNNDDENNNSGTVTPDTANRKRKTIKSNNSDSIDVNDDDEGSSGMDDDLFSTAAVTVTTQDDPGNAMETTGAPQDTYSASTAKIDNSSSRNDENNTNNDERVKNEQELIEPQQQQQEEIDDETNLAGLANMGTEVGNHTEIYEVKAEEDNEDENEMENSNEEDNTENVALDCFNYDISMLLSKGIAPVSEQQNEKQDDYSKLESCLKVLQTYSGHEFIVSPTQLHSSSSNDDSNDNTPWSPLATNLNKVLKFLQNVVLNNLLFYTDAKASTQAIEAAAIYVCGNPGTGKTSGVEWCCQNFIGKFNKDLTNDSVHLNNIDINNNDINVSYLVINSTYIKDGKDGKKRVLDEIANHLKISYPNSKKQISNETAILEALRIDPLSCTQQTGRKPKLSKSTAITTKNILFLIVDEIDQLVSNSARATHSADENLVKFLFDWSNDPSIGFGLIGISNSVGNKEFERLIQVAPFPRDVTFNPYNVEDLTSIVQSRIDSNIVHPAAIKYVASKVASNSGDVRKLFELLTNAIRDCQKNLPKQLVNTSSIEGTENNNRPIVTIKHVAKVDPDYNRCDEAMSGLPLMRKVMLCAAINLIKRNPKRDVTRLEFEKDCIHALRMSNFNDGMVENDELNASMDQLQDANLLKIEHSVVVADNGAWVHEECIYLTHCLPDMEVALDEALKEEGEEYIRNLLR